MLQTVLRDAGLAAVEAPEIPRIYRQKWLDAMHVHVRCEPGVMDLYTLDVVREQKGSPAGVDFLAVRQKVEVPLDHMGEAIGFRNAQAETILFTWSG